MKIDLLPKSVNADLEVLAEMECCPIGVYAKGTAAKRIAEKGVKGVVSSYPIYKDGNCYDIEIDLAPNVWYTTTNDGRQFECGYGHAPERKGWTTKYSIEVMNDIAMPMIKRLKEEYDKCIAETERIDTPMLVNESREGGGYECWHAFGDLVLEGLVLDTDTMTIEMEIGS